MNSLVKYLTVACTNIGKSTFYNASKDQKTALEDTHASLLTENRRFYALSAAFPINDRSRQLILENLLKTGSHCQDGALEGQVISLVVSELQFNRVLNMFCELREKKVNNARTRKLGELIWGLVDEYRAIKYRNKIRTVLRHCHIAEGPDPARAEMHRWIFGGNTKHSRPELTAVTILHNPKIRARLEAPTNYAKLFELPFDIARDIAVHKYGKTAADFEREFVGTDSKNGQPAEQGKGTATRKETMRARQKTGDTVVNFDRFDLFELFQAGYRNRADRAAISSSIERKAKDIAEGINLPGKVALVIDNSVSALGSAERRFQPLAMISSVVAICKATESEIGCYYVGEEPEGNFIEAEGASNLRKPLVQAFLSRPDLVIILSDGYENVRAGSVNQILNTTAVKNSGIPVLHLNPVAAVENEAKSRTLSPLVMSFGIASPNQLPMVTLVGLAAQDPKLLEPVFGEVEKYLRLGDFRQARLATRMAGLPALTA